uniref:Nucleotidyltransferase family protein n=1 Tax=Desulfatirhabdium butyrativorans TaxID=340467 RepID=A0A7C4RRY9_9BACT
MKIGAIIPAAGASSRMGQDKALLPLAGGTVLKRILDTHRRADIDPILVISGANDEELRRRHPDAILLRNPHPDRGMFSSIQTGALALTDDIDAFFVHPVDIPLVRSKTLLHLKARFTNHKIRCPDAACLLSFVPVHRGRRGHPPLLTRSFVRIIREDAGENGLATVLRGHTIVEVPCDDPGVLIDMNTPEAYRKVCERLEAVDCERISQERQTSSACLLTPDS